MPKPAYVYMLANPKTSQYHVTGLVWLVQGEDIAAAIELEKKINLIEKTNPHWNDLSAEWVSSSSCDCAQGDGGKLQGDGAGV